MTTHNHQVLNLVQNMKISKNNTIFIIGGDARQMYLYNRMIHEGFHVTPYDVPGTSDVKCLFNYHHLTTIDNALSDNDYDYKNPQYDNVFSKPCDIFILPIPFSRDGIKINSKSSEILIDELLSCIKAGSIVIGGVFSDIFINKCRQKNIITYDLMDNPDFELMNAIATAEGAIAEAVTKSPLNIHFSECLVLGFGKCGKAIADRLGALNGNVTVCARRTEQQVQAYENGHSYIDFISLENNISKFDFIFNSVPSMVLTKNSLEHVKPDAVIIDIASKPGGTDFEQCTKLGINAHLCLSLPGKYSPKASADIIYKCIENVNF